MRSQKKSTIWLTSVVSCFITFCVVFLLYFVKGYAPFGNNSTACLDANTDYLDFFCGLKDVIEGKTSFIYSFSKGLGGCMVGHYVTGYFSPFNLLLVFFEKKDMHSFFDLVVALKMALGALTMSVFLQKRFDSLKKIFTIVLAICYGLCQYNFAQASNIFFLEGSYMLPLIMLGTHYAVNDKSKTLLILSVTYSVAVAWYTGGMNCFFTVFWTMFEVLWVRETQGCTIKDATRRIANVAISGVTGVLISGIVFIPTIFSLKKSSEGSLDFYMLKNITEFMGNAITIVTNYHWGAVSNPSMVSLFCGSIALVGCVAFFASSHFNIGQKKVVGSLLVLVTLMYYWYPLFHVFSLLKSVTSFWSRYGYIGSFTMLFASGLFLECADKDKAIYKRMIPTIMIIITAYLLYYKDSDNWNIKWIYATVFSIGIVTFLLLQYVSEVGSDSVSKKKKSTAIIGLLLIFTVFEMFCNSWLVMNAYHQKDVDYYSNYMEQGQKQIYEIKSSDDGFFRISQTKNRANEGLLTANYDEPHAFNYWGITSYTSVPDDIPREFMDRSGYRINGEDIYIVNYPILPVDSLVGVKYVLSDVDIPGMVKNSELGKYNNKEVYSNPYALPLAFTLENNDDKVELNYKSIEPAAGRENKDINPFLYQNDCFSQLAGRGVELYTPIEFKKTSESKEEVTYLLDIPEKYSVIYGNLPWAFDGLEKVYVDGELVTGYSRWLSPKVFPIKASKTETEVKVVAENEVSITGEQFYALDLDALKEITSTIQKNEVLDYTIKDGYFEANTISDKDELLITTIPYDKHWSISVNGQATEPEIYLDTFISIPLKEGHNNVVFNYHIGGLKEGLISALVGIIILILLTILQKTETNRWKN